MAKTITVSIPHRLTKDEAKRRITTGIENHRAQFEKMAHVENHWNGDRMEFKATAMGQSITGRADITADAVVVNLDLPWMLAMMAGKIQNQIEGEGRKLLE